MFKLIYLLLNEDFNFFDKQENLNIKIVDNLYNIILEKYQADSLSKENLYIKFLYIFFHFLQRNYL